MTPITRKEMFLAKLSGEAVTTPDPITREELFLAKLCGESVETPEPITRTEFFLDSLAGNEHTLTPVTRIEYFIAAAGGADVPELTPITREEMYWSDISISGVIERTVTGSLIHITDALALPAEALSVKLEPVQDLHGYDAPWPAGGGKNKADFPVSTSLPYSERLTTVFDAGEDITVSNLVLSFFLENASFSNGQGAICDFKKNDGTHQYRVGGVYGISEGQTYTGQYSHAESNITFRYLNVMLGADYIHFTSGKASVQLEMDTSTATPFAPYSNICPITGFDSVTVNRTGKNLLPTWEPVSNSNGLTSEVNNDGSVRIYGTATGTGGYISGFISIDNPLALKETSSIVGFTTSLPDRVRVFFRNNAGEQGSADVMAGQSSTPVNSLYVPYDISRIAFFLFTTAGKAYDFTIYPQLELGSTATAYEPYSGNEYTIQLGETVYGGTLDVVNGKMTVDRYYLHVDAVKSTWGASNGFVRCYRYMTGYDTAFNTPLGSGGIGICNMLAYYTNMYNRNAEGVGLTSGANGYFSIALTTERLNLSGSETSAELLTAMNAWLLDNPLYILYPLATPFEIQLTPTQIPTLQGTNNVWSDAGLITLKYSTKGLTTYLLKP